MATIGKQLTAPETGWKRYDNTHPAINYVGSWGVESNAAAYSGSIKKVYQPNGVNPNEYVEFKFVGTKIRIIARTYPNQGTDAIELDGVKTVVNTASMGDKWQTLIYEATGLENKVHTVKFYNETGQYTSGLDAIDIDDTGYLVVQVGQQLISPEPGWKRYDDTHPAFKYVGSWSVFNTSGTWYKGASKRTSTINDYVEFDFIGTKLRIISSNWSDNTTDMQLEVDGTLIGHYNASTKNLTQTINFEVTELPNIRHRARLTLKASGFMYLDAVDIDDTGRLLHPDEVTDIADLDVGKRIRCHYQAPMRGQIGMFSGLGQETSDFIPTASSATPNGDFYWICVDKDHLGRWKLIADRNIQHSISWDTLNSEGIASGSGLPIIIDNNDIFKIQYTIRLLKGGVTYSDIDNEWYHYIVNSTLNNTIIAGDNNVWNWSKISSWVSTTSNGGYRFLIGNTNVNSYTSVSSSSTSISYGFRPVLLIESFYTAKYLFEDNGEIKKYVKTNEPIYKVEYQGNVLPDLATPAWTKLNSLVEGEIAPDGSLHINDTSGGYCAYQMNNIVSPDKVVTVEVKVKVISASAFSTDTAYIPPYFSIRDGSREVSVYMRPNEIKVGRNIGTTAKAVDLTTYRVIKLIKYGGTKWEVYVDGVLVDSSTVFDTPTSSADKDIIFGGGGSSGTGDVYFGYVRYTEDTQYKNIWQSIGLAPATEEMFLTNGMDDLSAIDNHALQQLVSDTPKLLMYIDDVNKTSASVKLTAVPHGQLIFQEGDMDVSAGVESLFVNATVQNSSILKIIASADRGVTWKTFNGTTWQSITPNAASVKANGMTPNVINGLTKAQIDDLLQGSNTLRFAYYLEQDQLNDVVNVDDISITASPVATETPTLDSIKIVYDELTIEGRMQDLERINAINMAKLQFKSNALLQSDKYKLHDLVVDTFESTSGVDISNTNAVYDAINKEFIYDVSGGAPAVQEVVLQEEDLPVYRKKFMLHTDYDGNIDYEYSLDGGMTWNPITPFTIIDLTGQTGTKLKVKAKLKDSTAKLRGIAFSWA